MRYSLRLRLDREGMDVTGDSCLVKFRLCGPRDNLSFFNFMWNEHLCIFNLSTLQHFSRSCWLLNIVLVEQQSRDSESDRSVRYVEGITQLETYVNYNTYMVSRWIPSLYPTLNPRKPLPYPLSPIAAVCTTYLNVRELCILPTECIFMFRVIFTVNISYCLKQ